MNCPVRSAYKISDEEGDPGYLDGQTVSKMWQARDSFYLNRHPEKRREFFLDKNEIIQVWSITAACEQIIGQDDQTRADLSEQIWRRAVLQAEAEGKAWAPVIDVMARHIIGKHPRMFRSGLYVDPLLPEVMARVETLKPWVAATPLAEVLAAIGELGAKALWELIVSNYIEAGPMEARQVMDRTGSEVMAIFLANNSMSDEVVADIAEDMLNWPAVYGAPNEDRQKAGIVILAEYVKRLGPLPAELAKALLNTKLGKDLLINIEALAIANSDTPIELLEQIFMTSRDVNNQAKILCHPKAAPKAGAWYAKQDRGQKKYLGLVLLGMPETTPELLAEIIPVGRTNEIDWIAKIIAHPNTPHAEAVRVGLLNRSHPEVRIALARRESTRVDAVIKGLLDQSTAQGVLIAMLEGATTTDQLVGTLRKMLKRDMLIALQCLARMPIRPGVVLPQALFKQVLMSPSKDLKILAMSVIKRWGDAQALAGPKALSR